MSNENNCIMEMNVSPNPAWAKEYAEILRKHYNLGFLDSMCAVGELETLLKKHNIKID